MARRMVITSRRAEVAREPHRDGLPRTLRRLEAAGVDRLIRCLPEALLLVQRGRLAVRADGLGVHRAVRADDQLVRREVAAPAGGPERQAERAGGAPEQARRDI